MEAMPQTALPVLSVTRLTNSERVHIFIGFDKVLTAGSGYYVWIKLQNPLPSTTEVVEGNPVVIAAVPKI